MKQQHLLLLAFTLTLTANAAAFDGVSERPSSGLLTSDGRHNVDVSELRYEPAEPSLISLVTMRRFPAGSLIVDYDGPQRLAIKHARSQVRLFARRYQQRSDNPPIDLDVWNNAPTTDAWWSRTWLDSLTPEMGGAPAEAYVHTVGTELSWSVGPLTLSNTLKFKLNYLAVFNFNPDPGEETGDRSPPPVSIDVNAAEGASVGTWVKFKLRPNISVGLPSGDDWLGAIRNISIRAEFDITVYGTQVLKGDVVLKYTPGDDLTFLFEVTIGRW